MQTSWAAITFPQLFIACNAAGAQWCIDLSCLTVQQPTTYGCRNSKLIELRKITPRHSAVTRDAVNRLGMYVESVRAVVRLVGRPFVITSAAADACVPRFKPCVSSSSAAGGHTGFQTLCVKFKCSSRGPGPLPSADVSGPAQRRPFPAILPSTQLPISQRTETSPQFKVTILSPYEKDT